MRPIPVIAVAVLLGFSGACSPAPLTYDPPPGLPAEPGPSAPPARPLDPGHGPPADQQRCPCSRRPDGSPAFQCPRGADESARVVLGPSGGTVTLKGQQGKGVAFKLEVPPQPAYRETTTITVTEISEPPPAGFTDYSPVYRIAPAPLPLANPAVLRVPWSNRLREINPALAIYWAPASEGPFERLPDSYINAGFSQAQLVRTGFVFVGYPAALDPPGCLQVK